MGTPPIHELRYWNALRSADSSQSRRATHVLSALLCQRGERGGAERLLRDSLKAHGSAGAAGTWYRLGRLLEAESRISEAEAAFSQAHSLASVTEDPEVLMDLAARWASLKEVERSIDLYRLIATEGTVQRLRTLAFYRLARVQVELDQLEEAQRSFSRALAEASPDLEPFVLVSLAELLADRGETAEATELLQRAVGGNHHDQAPRAALALARLRSKEGDGLEAYRLYQLAAESEHPDVASVAAAEKEKLVESELDLLLQPTWQAPEQQLLTRRLRLLSGELMEKRSERKSALFLATLCLQASCRLQSLDFERHKSTLLVPGHTLDCGEALQPIDAPGNLLILDSATHKLLHSGSSPPASSRKPLREVLDGYVYTYLIPLLHRESQWTPDEEEDDLFVLWQLIARLGRGREHDAHQECPLCPTDKSPPDEREKERWDSLCLRSPEEDGLWTRPLLTETAHHRISKQAGWVTKFLVAMNGTQAGARDPEAERDPEDRFSRC